MAHAGGLFELKKIAAMAEAHFIEVAPHNPLSEVTTMASIHLNASTLNCIILEHIGPLEGSTSQRKPIPWKKEIFKGEVVIKNGFAELPTAPGLGLELDKKEIAKHPYNPKLRPQWVWEDGSIAQW
jgi:galactonate dehydratase